MYLVNLNIECTEVQHVCAWWTKLTHTHTTGHKHTPTSCLVTVINSQVHYQSLVVTQQNYCICCTVTTVPQCKQYPLLTVCLKEKRYNYTILNMNIINTVINVVYIIGYIRTDAVPLWKSTRHLDLYILWNQRGMGRFRCVCVYVCVVLLPTGASFWLVAWLLQSQPSHSCTWEEDKNREYKLFNYSYCSLLSYFTADSSERASYLWSFIYV